jgi:hypothetical protein
MPSLPQSGVDCLPRQGNIWASPMMTNLTSLVALPPSAVEARLIAGMLESYGIATRVSADDLGGLEPQLQLTEGVRVFVAPEDAAAARELVAEAEENSEFRIGGAHGSP